MGTVTPSVGALGWSLLDGHSGRGHLDQIGFSIDLNIKGHGLCLDEEPEPPQPAAS